MFSLKPDFSLGAFVGALAASEARKKEGSGGDRARGARTHRPFGASLFDSYRFLVAP